MKIHPVVSIIHLEQVREDDYDRAIANEGPDPIVVEGEEHYVVEKIVKAETRDGIPDFKVKCKDYEEETWQSQEQPTDKRRPGGRKVRKFLAKKGTTSNITLSL